VKDLESKVSLA